MTNFDATQAHAGPLNCYSCGRVIPDGNWFARIRLGEGRVGLCGPGCVESFLEYPDRCAGAEFSTNSFSRAESARNHPPRSAETATSNWDRADCSRPMATSAVRFVNS